MARDPRRPGGEDEMGTLQVGHLVWRGEVETTGAVPPLSNDGCTRRILYVSV